MITFECTFSYSFARLIILHSLGLWEALHGSSDPNNNVHYDDRIAVGTAIGRVVCHLSDDTRIQVCDGMMKYPLERLERLVMNSQRTKSHDAHLHVLKRLGDEIHVIASLLHVFAFPYEHNSVKGAMAESMQADCEIPEAIFSIVRKAWPYVEIAASKWGNDEVGCFEIYLGLFCCIFLTPFLIFKLEVCGKKFRLLSFGSFTPILCVR